MAKYNLDDLLDGKDQTPIRRGRGLTLSIDEKPSVAGEASALVHHRTSASKSKKTLRINKGYKMRRDIDAEMKVLAAEKGRLLYEIMEEALITYLKKHGKNIS